MTHSNGANGANGHYAPLPLQAGIYSPLVTPFSADEEIDYAAWKTHVLRIAGAGVGLVIMGTNGEAVHLSTEERYALVAAARQYLREAGLPQHPIIAGAGSASVKETISNCRDAARAGADAVIVILPGYFAGAIGRDRAAIKQFFTQVADASPVPVLLYNFPACVAGVDMDSDLMTEISRHPNVCGAKLTCAQIGKGGRIVDALTSVKQGTAFHIWTGFADILLPSMMVGMTGTICGTANLVPRTTVQLYNLIKEAQDIKSWDKLQEAQKLQQIVAKADWAMAKAGIGGTKWALSRWYYPVGECRLPLQPASKEVQAMLTSDLQEALALERQLEQRDGVTPAKA